MKHQGQTVPPEYCTRCFLTDHAVWNCKNGYACRACKSLTHREGNEECKYFTENNNCHVFGGRRGDLLSNFSPSQFSFDENTYVSREQGYQHLKACIHKHEEVAKQIMRTSDPGLAKEYGKCVRVGENWEEHSEEVMKNICRASAAQDESYLEAILSTNNKKIVEAMHSNLEWASGMSWQATSHTRHDRLPGQNKMGRILMDVRDSLQKAQLPTPVKETHITNDDKNVDENDEREKDLKEPEVSISSPETEQFEDEEYEDEDTDDFETVPPESTPNTKNARTKKKGKRGRSKSGQAMQSNPKHLKALVAEGLQDILATVTKTNHEDDAVS